MVKQTKKTKEIAQLVDRAKTYAPEEAIGLAKQAAVARFDETVELHLRMGVDPRNATQQVRGVALLPHGLGKKIRILVFAQVLLRQPVDVIDAALFGDFHNAAADLQIPVGVIGVLDGEGHAAIPAHVQVFLSSFGRVQEDVCAVVLQPNGRVLGGAVRVQGGEMGEDFLFEQVLEFLGHDLGHGRFPF